MVRVPGEEDMVWLPEPPKERLPDMEALPVNSRLDELDMETPAEKVLTALQVLACEREGTPLDPQSNLT